MPDHPHMLAEIEPGSKRRFSAILGAFSRRFELGEVWKPVPEPEPIETLDKQRRHARYIALNPCRPWRGGRERALVRDPLAWPWSTHRDVVGAVIDPWVDARRLAAAFDTKAADFVRVWHRYVSGDPQVSVTGTPLPERAEPRDYPAQPLGDVLRAVCAATRQPEDAIRRRGAARTLFVAMGDRQGWWLPALLAEACGAHPSTMRRLVAACPAAWLQAAAMCLGDPRLTCWDASAREERIRGSTRIVPG